MKVHLLPELSKRKPLAGLVETATPVLEEAIGPPAARVTATWDFQPDDRGRPLIQLTLDDWSGQASARFAPEELQPPDRAYRRFYRLWGDLLQEASQRRVQALEAMVAQEQDG